MIRRIGLTLDPATGEIGRARRALREMADRAGIAPKALKHLQVVLDELLSNEVDHVGRPYRVAFEARGDRIVLRLSDDGPAFDPTKPPFPVPADRPRIGGRGLDLVQKLADELSYRRDGGRNELTIIKRLDPGAEDASEMTQGLTISEDREGGAATVRLEGRIDSGNAGALTRHLTGLIEEGHATVVIDMAALDYLTSAGFRTLLIASDAAEERRGALRLRGMSNDVRELFELSGLLGAFEVEDRAADESGGGTDGGTARP